MIAFHYSTPAKDRKKILRRMNSLIKKIKPCLPYCCIPGLHQTGSKPCRTHNILIYSTHLKNLGRARHTSFCSLAPVFGRRFTQAGAPFGSVSGGNDMKSKKTIQIARTILFSLIPLLTVLLLVESFFRIFPPHIDSSRAKPGFIVQDNDLGWRLRRHVKGPLATNELGFRDAPLNRNADKKILLLGDSISWGDGINAKEKIYPCLLEQMLNQNTDHTYEVINSGVPGYSTFQQHRYLQLYGIYLNPDMIILQFCLNDVVERYSSFAHYGGDNTFLGVDTRKMIPGINGWLIRNSRAYEAIIRLLIKRGRNQQEYEVKKLASDRISHEIESAWALTLSEIGDINKIAVNKHIPLLVVIAPYQFQLTSHRRTDQPQKKIMKYCRDNNIAAIDLLPFFRRFHEKQKNVSLFNDANHFSVHGHHFASQVLFQAILSFLEEKQPNKANTADAKTSVADQQPLFRRRK